MPLKTYGQIVCLGVKPQTNISTANTTVLLRMNKLSEELPTANLNTENDAGQYGTGTPFATVTIPTNASLAFPYEAFANAKLIAWAMYYTLGTTAAPTGSNPYTYVMTYPAFSGGNVNLPYFSVVSVLGAAEDSLYRGNALGQTQITWETGAGTQNARVRLEVTGTGLQTNPSGVTPPATTSIDTQLLPAGALSVTWNTGSVINFTNNCRLRNITLTFNNNPNTLFCPGSGFITAGNPNSGQTAGAIYFGVPSVTIEATVEAVDNTELNALLAQTSGVLTVAATRTVPAAYGSTWVFHKAVLASRESASDQGDQCWRVRWDAQFHPTNGIVTFTGVTDINTIGQP